MCHTCNEQSIHSQFEELTSNFDCSQLCILSFTFGSIIIIRVNRVKLGHIEALINAARDGLDFGNQLLLNVLQVVTVI